VGRVRRGDVHEYAIGSRVVRAVIVSASQYAPGRIAMAPVAEVDPKGRAFGPAVPTGTGDPLVGSVDVGRIRPADAGLVRARVGTMSPATMGRISAALKDFLDLD
jgi:mRNA-degrading endonuclease toxin of MazEF toxin-antitoxin module